MLTVKVDPEASEISYSNAAASAVVVSSTDFPLNDRLRRFAEVSIGREEYQVVRVGLPPPVFVPLRVAIRHFRWVRWFLSLSLRSSAARRTPSSLCHEWRAARVRRWGCDSAAHLVLGLRPAKPALWAYQRPPLVGLSVIISVPRLIVGVFQPMAAPPRRLRGA